MSSLDTRVPSGSDQPIVTADQQVSQKEAAFDQAKYEMAYKKAVSNGFIKRSEPPRPKTFGEWS